jgi:hypothetical protein
MSAQPRSAGRVRSTAPACLNRPVTLNARESASAREYVTTRAVSRRFARGGASSRALRPLVIVLLVAVVVALELAREAAVSAWDTVWAEDGSVFLRDALNEPFLSTLVEPYGGYVHVIPRLIASVAGALPLDHAALVFSVAWAVVVSLSALFIYFASTEVFRSPWTRLAISLLAAFLPAAGSELLGNATNLHFYLIYTCFWALVWRSEKRGALAVRAITVVAATLSDPLTILFAPLVIHGVVVRKTRSAFVIPLVFASGLAIQLAAMAASESPQRLTRFDPADIAPLFALRVTGSLLVGDRFIDDLWFMLGRGFAYGSLAVVMLACFVGAAKAGPRTRVFVAVCCLYAATFFFVDLFGRGSAGMRPGSDAATWHLAGARFTYAPILFLSAALLAVADDIGRRFPSSAWRRIHPAALALSAAVVIANFSLSSERSLGPEWRPSLAAARAQCNRGVHEVHIPVAPGPFGFALTTTCARLSPMTSAQSVDAARSFGRAASSSLPR